MCIFCPVSGRTDNFKQLFVSYILKEGITPKYAVPIACHSWRNSSELSGSRVYIDGECSRGIKHAIWNTYLMKL